ncbi:MAG: DUF883 C-terminal domain-containing protein [Pseudorhodobacter sp.]|nr:DUF883 C-terminal domain-containing protein [Pseudorhodobacter sp.]
MATSKTPELPDDLREQIAILRADLARLTATAVDDVTETVGAARRKAVKSGYEAKDTVVDAVLANPLSAVGIAAGLGFLLGIFTRR